MQGSDIHRPPPLFNLIMCILCHVLAVRKSGDEKGDEDLKIREVMNEQPTEACQCKVYRMNNVIEVTACKKRSHVLEKYRRISKDSYIHVETGAIFEYEKASENRAENVNSLRHTFAAMRRLINRNFVGKKDEKHITLTYAENETDTEKVYKDFKKFWQRFKRKYGKAEYIAVLEPQERGAWHMHLLVKLIDNPDLFIRNDEELEPLWGHGWTTCKSITGVDNVGAYLTAYLSDVELDPEKADQLLVGVKEVKGKKYIKGARLYMYPTGVQLYRHSRGMIVPEPELAKYGDIKKEVGDATPTYAKTVEVLDDEGKELNTITYEHYNMMRQKREGARS